MKSNIITKNNSSLYLKELEYCDALGLKEWLNFTSEYMQGYNYGDFTNKDCDYWYRSVKRRNKKYFAVRLNEDDRMIGFIGLKGCNPILKKSNLGIVFDPAFVSKGYGFEAMSILLDYYFGKMNYKRLYLDVNDFNKRAYNLYKKLGFEEYASEFQVFENQKVKIDSDFFIERRGLIYSRITKMKICKEDW